MDLNKLVFVSGKGGVGKTTLGLLLAHSMGQKSKKVLFVELAPRSSAQSLLEAPNKPTYQPTSSGFGFDWCLISGVECLVEYIGTVTKVEKIAKNFFENSMVSSLLNVAPGLNDLAVLGKLTSSIRGHGPGFSYDHVIVDAHSTGHFSSMLSAPKHLGASVSMGPLKNQSEAIEEVLFDSNLVQYFFVSLFEKLPFDELSETLRSFEKSKLKNVSIVMNKFLEAENVQISDPAWQDFFSQRLKQQVQLTKALNQFDNTTYRYPLLTEDLSVVLKESKEVDFELL